MAFCADDIELWPPDSPPVVGSAAVAALLAQGTARINDIEIAERRIRGTDSIAYLTATYKTTFSSIVDTVPKQISGKHLWILRKRADRWLIGLVSWSLWDKSV
jgi:ketosteroid isomerase-like protein